MGRVPTSRDAAAIAREVRLNGEWRQGWELEVAAARMRAEEKAVERAELAAIAARSKAGTRQHFLASMAVTYHQLRALELWPKHSSLWCRLLGRGLEVLAAVLVVLVLGAGAARAQEGVCDDGLTLHDKAAPSGTSATNLNNSRLLTAAEADNLVACAAQLADWSEIATDKRGLTVTGAVPFLTLDDSTNDDWTLDVDAGDYFAITSPTGFGTFGLGLSNDGLAASACIGNGCSSGDAVWEELTVADGGASTISVQALSEAIVAVEFTNDEGDDDSTANDPVLADPARHRRAALDRREGRHRQRENSADCARGAGRLDRDPGDRRGEH